ncbi:sensor histidine kinase [Methylobacterium tarhaniae]|uniref:sensor histidine kinase n=1 Tax=Methylobacterium tarhaniae TaxID=1187852 RepID=UPI003D085A7E
MNHTEQEQASPPHGPAESEAWFQHLADHGPALMWVTDPNGVTTYLSQSWYACTGQTPETGLGLGWLDAVHPDDREGARAVFLAANAERGRFQTDYRLHHVEGGYRWMMDTAMPRFGPDGTYLGYVGTVIDITQRKRTEAALQESEARAHLLLAELQHRVRNTLAVVRSIARRSAETSATVADYAMHLDGRLTAFARAQVMVTRDPAAGIDLEALVAEELRAYQVGDGRQVRIEGPPVRLQPKVAEMLGLAIHELATNAIRHGALGQGRGRVQVSWRAEPGAEEPRLVLRWVETGVPLPSGPPQRGFGFDLLERMLPYELGGQTKLTLVQGGLLCTITVPLTPWVNDVLQKHGKPPVA